MISWRRRASRICLVGSVVLSAGCSVAPSDAAGPALSAAPTVSDGPAVTESPMPTLPATATTVDLPALGLSLTLPPAWTMDADDGQPWDPRFLPHPGQVGVRVATGEPAGYTLSMAAAELESPMALEDWADMQAGVIDNSSSCHGMPDNEPISVGGEPGNLAVYDRSDCEHNHHVLAVSVIRAGRGYIVHWVSPTAAEESERVLLESIIESVTFED